MEASKVPGASGHRGFVFGSFVADAVTRRLWRDGQLVPITGKTFDVLVVLLEHRDRLVTKDELLDRVWPDTAVQENNLTRQVSSLRRALGQRPDQVDYVLTVPGHGYRFIASAQELLELPRELRDANGVHAPLPQESESEIEEVPTDHPSLAERSPWPLATLVGVGAVVLAIALASLLLRRNGSVREAGRTLHRVTYDAASLPREAAWSPDGQWIVFVSNREGNADLWKQRIGNADPVRLTATETDESEPEWSPDGRAIVFRSERDGGGLFVMPADGGAERMVSSFGYEPRWSPDSTQILFKRSAILPDLPNLYLVGLDGKPPRPFRPDVLAQFAALQAAWHPDGRRISIWGAAQRGHLSFVNVAVDSALVTAPEMSTAVRENLAGLSPGRFVWARSGNYVYFEGVAGDTKNIWRITVDPVTEQLIDGPQRLTTGAEEETNVAVSPDGTKVLYTSSSSRTRLWAFPLDAHDGRILGEPHPITQGSTEEVDFDAQLDGSKVAYRAVRAGRNELRERSVDEGRERLLLSSIDRKLVKPRWSPDGAKLAFLRCGTRGDTPVLALVNSDGSGERALTKPDELEMLASDWSTDGASILGSCRFSPSDRYSSCVLPVSSQSAANQVRVIASDPKRNLFNQRFSPDQRWIAFLAHDLTYSSTSTVYVIPAAGGAWRSITDGSSFDDKPRWGPDGRILYYVSNQDGVRNVWARRFDKTNGTPIGEPFPVTSFRSPQFLLTPRTVQMDIAVTPTHLLLPMSESRSDLWALDQVHR